MDKVLPPDTTTSATATSTSRDTSRRDEHDTDYDPLRVGPPRMPGPLPLPGMGPVPDGSPGFGGERRGDFSGDLMPGVGGGFPGSGGSLMGPDHPMFGGPSGMGYPQFMQLGIQSAARSVVHRIQYSSSNSSTPAWHCLASTFMNRQFCAAVCKLECCLSLSSSARASTMTPHDVLELLMLCTICVHLEVLVLILLHTQINDVADAVETKLLVCCYPLNSLEYKHSECLATTTAATAVQRAGASHDYYYSVTYYCMMLLPIEQHTQVIGIQRGVRNDVHCVTATTPLTSNCIKFNSLKQYRAVTITQAPLQDASDSPLLSLHLVAGQQNCTMPLAVVWVAS
eukprot:9440-Heterococcus_DN1.PRE.2